MQLNEIIEENTLPSISKRTRISVENLEALISGDWGRLKKVQALGFISILEREYHLNLEDMREECRRYFAEFAPEDEERGPVIGAVPEPEHRGPSKGLIFLVILLAGVGGYILFFSPAQTGGEANTTVTERRAGFFDSVMTTAKGWFGTAEEQGVSETAPAEEVPALKGAWAEGNGSGAEKNQTTAEAAGTASAGMNEKSAESDPQAKNLPDAEEAQIIQQVKKEQAKAEEIRKQATEEGNLSPAAGENKEPLSDISRMILAATAGGAAPAEAAPAEDGAMDAEVPSLTQEKTAEAEREGVQAAKAPQEKQTQEAPAQAGEKTEAPAAVTDTLVVMHPRSKIWVGYTNLRNMKRTAKVTTGDITFDTATGDYILAVGHGQIDFKTANGEKRLNDGKRHFFMIAKGDVREISHEEFQRLNKSKVW